MSEIHIKNPDKEGWLEKQSRYLKRWKLRWFVLKDFTLYSFKERGVYRNPTEVIDLRIYTSVKSAENNLNGNTFDLYSSGHIFSFIASNEGDKEDWIRALGRAIVLSNTSRVHDDHDDDEEDYDDSD